MERWYSEDNAPTGLALAITTALEKAYQEGLEDAAKVADTKSEWLDAGNWGITSDQVADVAKEIRALKSTKGGEG